MQLLYSIGNKVYYNYNELYIDTHSMTKSVGRENAFKEIIVTCQQHVS